MSFSVGKINNFKFVQQMKILVISINKKSCEVFLFKPLSPIHFLTIIIPDTAKIAADN